MSRPTGPVTLALLSAAIVAAEFVGGKATRDALFLSSLQVTALPAMLMATALCSILLAAGHTKALSRFAPTSFVPAFFVASGVMFVLEWCLLPLAPVPTAVIVYLHVSGAGPLVASGFWLVASERFDPNTAKRRFGQIAGAGTIGGVLGALAAERVGALAGAPPMLLVLAVLQVAAAVLVYRLAAAAGGVRLTAPAAAAPATDEPGLRTTLRAPHLRPLMVLVICGTTSAALLDYVFKIRAVAFFGPGDGLLRFFAIYYAATSLLAFVLQVFGSRWMLERFGLALTTSSPSVALLAGSVASLVAPGLGSLVVTSGAESVFRGSWYRAAYELFFTPLAPAERRAAKSLIDVALDRTGDALGGGIARLAIAFLPVAQVSFVLGAAMTMSAAAIYAASRLNHWYLRLLERSLVRQGADLDLSWTRDAATALTLIGLRERHTPGCGHSATMTRPAGTATGITIDPLMQDVLTLKSGRRQRIVCVLARDQAPAAGLVPHVIPLLASPNLAGYALHALRKLPDERVGELVSALLDAGQQPVVRTRLARVLGTCSSQQAVDALVLALDDPAFEVRRQAARSLVAIRERNREAHIDLDRIHALALREIAFSGPTRTDQRPTAGTGTRTPFIRKAPRHQLDHIFTLLSIVLPREPLRIALRGLQSEDPYLRGTALEYLEGLLPTPIRQRLWPVLQ